MAQVLHRRRWVLLSLAIVVPAGFYSKLYAGRAAHWVNNSLSGVPYEVFWCLLLYLFLGRSRPWAIAVAVLVVTCLLEFLQLWHPPFLEAVRGTLLGRTLLGTSFTWLDFPYYVAGCVIGWVWVRYLVGMANRAAAMESRPTA